MIKMNIQGYNFEGPWFLGQEFSNVPGIYVVFTNSLWLDVGETDKLGDRINGDNHERKPDWIKNTNGNQIKIAFFRESNSENRLKIESYLRLILKPVCGDR
ncbi:MAG: hypothetical protein HW400_893 [Candidatus Levybacteria bacterium]|nr:hypothetical protein [Candidatus Levybacteria bacterium]